MKPAEDEDLRDAARALFHAADASPADHEATRLVILAAAARQKRVRSAGDYAVAAALVCGIASASWVQLHAQSVVRPWLEQAMSPSEPRPDRDVADGSAAANAAAVAQVADGVVETAVTAGAMVPEAGSKTDGPIAADARRTVAEAGRVRHLRRGHARSEASSEASTIAVAPRPASDWAAFDRGYHVTTPAPLVVISPERDSVRWGSTQAYTPVSGSVFRERPSRNARFVALNPRDRLASLGPIGALLRGSDPSQVNHPVTFRTWQ